MPVRVLVLLGFIFSLALQRCNCLPPLLDGTNEGDEATGQAPIDPAPGAGENTPRTSSLSVTTAGGSIASPNYRMELSVGRTTQGSSPGFQLRPSTVGDK